MDLTTVVMPEATVAVPESAPAVPERAAAMPEPTIAETHHGDRRLLQIQCRSQISYVIGHRFVVIVKKEQLEPAIPRQRSLFHSKLIYLYRIPVGNQVAASVNVWRSLRYLRRFTEIFTEPVEMLLAGVQIECAA